LKVGRVVTDGQQLCIFGGLRLELLDFTLGLRLAPTRMTALALFTRVLLATAHQHMPNVVRPSKKEICGILRLFFSHCRSGA